MFFYVLCSMSTQFQYGKNFKIKDWLKLKNQCDIMIHTGVRVQFYNFFRFSYHNAGLRKHTFCLLLLFYGLWSIDWIDFCALSCIYSWACNLKHLLFDLYIYELWPFFSISLPSLYFTIFFYMSLSSSSLSRTSSVTSYSTTMTQFSQVSQP